MLEKSCQVKFSEIIFVSFSFFVFSVSREISQWCDKKKSEVARPAFQEKKKSLRDSESLPVVQQQTHIRPISWSKQSEIVKGGPSLWLAVVQIFLYVCENVCAAAVRQRERGVIEMCAVLPT